MNQAIPTAQCPYQMHVGVVARSVLVLALTFACSAWAKAKQGAAYSCAEPGYEVEGHLTDAEMCAVLAAVRKVSQEPILVMSRKGDNVELFVSKNAAHYAIQLKLVLRQGDWRVTENARVVP